jgi:hypothetical protein
LHHAAQKRFRDCFRGRKEAHVERVQEIPAMAPGASRSVDIVTIR